MKTNQQNAIDAYNNACFETQRKSLHNLGDWHHQTPRTMMGDLVVEERDAANDNELPLGVNWAVFDWAVNSGPSRAAKALQRAVGSFEEGAIGPKTLEAVKASNRVDIIESMANEREAFYRSLSTFDTFGKGWLRRNQETMEQALQMG